MPESLSLKQIISALPRLSHQELQQLRDTCSGLLAQSSTVSDSFIRPYRDPQNERLYNCILKGAKRRGINLPPYAALRPGSSVEKSAKKALLAISETKSWLRPHVKGLTAAQMRVAVVRALVPIALRMLREQGIPATPRPLLDQLAQPRVLLDTAYPGYPAAIVAQFVVGGATVRAT